MNLTAVYQGIQNIMSFPVILHCLKEFFPSIAFLIKDKLFDGGENICAGSDSACLRACKIIVCSSLAQIFSFFYTEA